MAGFVPAAVPGQIGDLMTHLQYTVSVIDLVTTRITNYLTHSTLRQYACDICRRRIIVTH